MKKTRLLVFCSAVLALALLCAAGGSRVMAQTTSNAVGAAQSAPVPSRITQAIDATQLTTLKGSIHPLARPEFDRGPVPDATPMNRMLFFLQRSPEQEAALQELMAGQMSKGSANFHRWLTPAQFGTQFGPADADIQTITDWLGAQGFHDIKVGTGKLTIEFSGNVGLVRNAFHTDIHHFQVHGEMRQANVSNPQIPAALAPVVAGIVSLHNFPKKSMRQTAGVFTRLADGRLVSQLTGSTNQFFALGPADFATIYTTPTTLSGAGTLTGAGTKIGIVGISDINVQDVRDFRTLFGLPPNDPVVVHNGPAPGINGEEGEADLDVQWSGATAPGAEIDFVTSEDTETVGGVELSSLYIVDNNSDDIMSLSFGECEAGLGQENAFLNSLWEQAAAQGITVVVSAGDPGSAGCDNFNSPSPATHGLAVSGIASTPFNIAVGGTDFDDVGNQATFWKQNPNANDPTTRKSVLGYIPETAWNDSCAATATPTSLATCVGAPANLLNIVGGSGGASTLYPKPTWQNVTTPADSARDIPDVSLFASDGPQSQSFYVVCEADAVQSNSCASSGSFSFVGVGGTSAAAPALAGVLALIEEAEANAGPPRSRRQGNANFVLYRLAQSAASRTCTSSNRTNPANPAPAGCVFNDVTKGNNSVPCTGGSTNCSSTTAGTNGVLVTVSGATKTPAFTATAGYDLATGLGSLNVANLQLAWGAAVGAFTPTTTTTSINGATTPVNVTHGTSVTLGATVTSGAGTPTGDVSFPVLTTVNGGVGSAPLSGGAASLPTTFLPGGTYTVKAHYAGDISTGGTFAASDDLVGVPVVVNKEASKLQVGIVTFGATGAVTNSAATTVAYGSPYILRIDILNHNGTATNCQLLTTGTSAGCAFDATGNVTITDNGSALDAGTFPINSEGHAEDQAIQLSAGSHPLVANYSGDISYSAAAAVNQTITVTKATTTTQVTSNVTTVASGGSVTLSATVNTTSSGAGPTGTVTFMNGSAALGTPQTCAPVAATSTTPASCSASLTTTISLLVPPASPQRIPRGPVVPVWILGCLLTLLALLGLTRMPVRRRAYAFGCLAFFALLTFGFAGCGGSGGGGGNSKIRSITAVYSGDNNYGASTSTAVQITIQ